MVHGLQRDVLRTVFVKHEGVFREQIKGWQITSDLVAGTIWADYTSCPFWNWEQVLKQDALGNVVQDFEAVYKLGIWLWVVNTRQNVLRKLIFNPEVTLEMVLEEIRELSLQILRRATLGE